MGELSGEARSMCLLEDHSRSVQRDLDTGQKPSPVFLTSCQRDIRTIEEQVQLILPELELVEFEGQMGNKTLVTFAAGTRKLIDVLDIRKGSILYE